MSKRNKNRILTETHNKLMVRDNELGRVLNKTEMQQWHDLINKIRDFDEKYNSSKVLEVGKVESLS